MPVASVFCPHCEKLVEIQVAAVTRSRPCPACGEALVLQLAETKGGTPRKAMLVGGALPAFTVSEPLVNRFEGLPVDPYDRMRLDPSLVRMRRQFLGGVAAVLVLVAVAVVVHFLDLQPQGTSSGAKPMSLVDMEGAPRNIQHVQPAVAAVSLEERLDRLKSGEQPNTAKKDEKFAAPVFDVSNEIEALKKDDKAAPAVFEVSEAPTIVTPDP